MTTGPDATPAPTQDSMSRAEEAIAVARARLTANVGTLRTQTAMLLDPEVPAVTVRSSTGPTDAVDLAAIGLRVAGRLVAMTRAVLRRPGPLLAAAGVTFALLRRRRVRRKRRELLEG